MDKKKCTKCGNNDMTPCGFGDCNGWECDTCGYREYDMVSYKMGGCDRYVLNTGNETKGE